MKSFEEEYRNRLDRMSVPPDFAATVRGRAAAQTSHAERERPQFVAAAAQASSEKQGRPQRLDASAASIGADRRRCRRIDAAASKDAATHPRAMRKRPRRIAAIAAAAAIATIAAVGVTFAAGSFAPPTVVQTFP